MSASWRFWAALGAIAAAAAILFSAAPALDLAVSGLFWREGEGFHLRAAWPARLAYDAVPVLTQAVLAALALAVIVLVVRRRPAAARAGLLDRRSVAFLGLSLLLGPGLVVNGLLKSLWGRARPSQVEAFGGAQPFTPALVPADACLANCSFVAGHAAMAFWFVAFAFLLSDRRSRRAAFAAGLAFGAVVGFGRIVQGAHFLSDVVFAGIVVVAVVAATHWVVVDRDLLARPWVGHAGRAFAGAGRRARAAAPPPRRIALGLALLLAAAALLAGLAGFDLAVARAAARLDGQMKAVFEVVTMFGLSTGWLVGAFALFLLCRLAAAGTDDWRRAERARAWSYVPLYVFAAIAASGIANNLLKALFGRARPRLLFREEIYGFDWIRFGSDYLSFPSGHATNIAALMTALWVLWPRHVALYALLGALVAGSRVAINAHYLSDVVAGVAIGIAGALVVRRVFARAGIDLAQAKAGRGSLIAAVSWRRGLGLPDRFLRRSERRLRVAVARRAGTGRRGPPQR